MNHIVRLSVSPSVRLFVGLSVFSNIAWSVSLPLRNNYIFYILQWFVITNGCVMIVNQGHLGKSKVPGIKSAKFVSGLSFSNEDTFKVRTLHEYYFSHECVSRVWPKVVLKILMALNKKKNPQKCAWSMSFIWRKIERSYLNQRLLITCRYVMILTSSHFWRFKVTRRKSAKNSVWVIFFLQRNIGSSNFTQILLITWRHAMILTKGLLDKFKATERKHASSRSLLKVHNACLGYILKWTMIKR